jgi:hypothetical protein
MTVADANKLSEFVVSKGRLRLGDVAGTHFLGFDAAVGEWYVIKVKDLNGLMILSSDIHEQFVAAGKDVDAIVRHIAKEDDGRISMKELKAKYLNLKRISETMTTSNPKLLHMDSGILALVEKDSWDSEVGFLKEADYAETFKKNVEENGMVPTGHGLATRAEDTRVICIRNELTNEVEGIIIQWPEEEKKDD